MRNIYLSDFESHRLRNLDKCVVFCHDRQKLYACGKNVIIKHSVHCENVICNLLPKDNLVPYLCSALGEHPNDTLQAIGISYCSETDFLYVALEHGDIFSLDLSATGSIQKVAFLDNGIRSIQWSPDQEFVAVVTGNDKVVVLNKEYDILSEVKLHDNEFGEKQFISVGWGKKETQFRGSEGKYRGNKPDCNWEKAEDNDKIKISWRGDSELFVVSSINPVTKQRYLRIFNKIGILQYTGENVNGLEYCLSWKPSGNLIASSQKLANKYVICFFEKNGLKHGEFTLPFSFNDIQVEEVAWNKDSKILVVLVSNISNKEGPSKCIYLYTTNNYHWYCKYTINFDQNVNEVLLQWDSQKCNSLHVILLKNKEVCHCKYSWLWEVNKSKGNTLKDESFVGVIDGCNLLLTPFKQGILPPPMFKYSLQTPVPINSIAFGPKQNGVSNDLCLQLSNGDILIYKYSENCTENVKHKLISKLTGINKECSFLYNLQWVASKTLILCLIKIDKNGSCPYLLKIDIKEFEVEPKYTSATIQLPSSVAFIRASESKVIIYLNDGILYSYYDDNIKVLYENEKHTFIESEVEEMENKLYVFALDNLNKFYINNIIFLNNVLSFHVVIHQKLVLLTNLQNELLCLNFEQGIPCSNDFSESKIIRKVERGSRIITLVHKDMRVLLQMPRGNLECIQPRTLSLQVVQKHLDSLNYYEAFSLMRKQRINLNLLYDHNPKAFAENVNVFIDQIKDLQWINLFLSDLINEDITKSMYSAIYRMQNTEIQKGESKVDNICGMLEKAFKQQGNPDKFLLPILTCYIKRNKEEYLELVLQNLKELKDKELKGIKSVISFNEAFKFILYLVDVEKLYKTALGMYDFDLVLIIASKSQKDPKEYLSFLNEIKQFEPNYQKFKIDKYLKKYKKALKNLIQCSKDDLFNECLDFIETQNLHKFALKLIPQDTDLYKNVCVSYGEKLMEHNLYEEAGIVYANAGMYKNAMEAYKKSGNWYEVIACGREIKLSDNELNELYLDLAMELYELKMFKESATVYLEYLKDVEEGVKSLVSGKFFSEAYRLSQFYEKNNLISEIIIPAVIEQGNLTLLQISNFYETFIRQKNRLQVVRKQKMEHFENKSEFDDNDLYSEINSAITQSNATSRNTSRTYRSAKNKRKLERKLLSLKEGSPFEDLALVTSLYNVVTNCLELKSEVKELNTFLIKIKKYETAEILQEKLKELLKIIEKHKSEIWTPELLNSKACYGPNSTSNEIAAMYLKTESLTPILLNPKFALAPENNDSVKWRLEILDP